MKAQPAKVQSRKPSKVKIVLVTALGALAGMLGALVLIAVRAVLRDLLSARSLGWVVDVADWSPLAVVIWWGLTRRRPRRAPGGAGARQGEGEQASP